MKMITKIITVMKIISKITKLIKNHTENIDMHNSRVGNSNELKLTITIMLIIIKTNITKSDQPYFRLINYPYHYHYH